MLIYATKILYFASAESFFLRCLKIVFESRTVFIRKKIDLYIF